MVWFAFLMVVVLLTSTFQITIWMFFSALSLPDPAAPGNSQPGSKVKCDCPTNEDLCSAPQDSRETAEEGKEEEEGDGGEEKRGGGNVARDQWNVNDVADSPDLDQNDRDYLEGLGFVKDSRQYLLLVVVLSSPSAQGKERRDTIRATWKGYPKLGDDQAVLVEFVVGTFLLATSELQVLVREQEEHHDLILLPSLKESYYNLSLKVLETFVWVDRNLEFSYLLKCDDDSFVMTHIIAEELYERDSTHSLYWGFFDGRATPKKGGKYVEKEWFLCDHYLPYALGGGYIVSADLVHKVALVSDGLRLYNNEDTSLGVWLSPFKAERKHDTRFDTEFVSRGCRNSYIISHKQSMEDMLRKHQLLQTRGKLCEKEYQTRLSYEYNWNEPPSKCCERTQGIQ